MARWFLFDGSNKLSALADTDDIKNSILNVELNWTAKQASEQDYQEVIKENKFAIYDGSTVTLSNPHIENISNVGAFSIWKEKKLETISNYLSENNDSEWSSIYEQLRSFQITSESYVNEKLPNGSFWASFLHSNNITGKNTLQL